VEKKAVVFIAHVSYAGGVRESARKFDCFAMTADDQKKLDIQFVRDRAGGSLLANSFNSSWCTALNMQERFEKNNEPYYIKYWGLLHDDIVPEDGWLKHLIEEADANEADLVSAVVPLKEFSGVTSSAIDLLGDDPFDGGHWSVERRLTLTEAHRQKPTFTAADLGFADRRLLANTGCWICRFDKPWIREVDERGNAKLFFTINDRIRRDPQTGLWRTFVEPEDWFFSRQLQNVGGKVCLTTRVKLCHWGLTPYPNYPNGDGECYGEKPYDYAHAERAQYTAIGDEKPQFDLSYQSTELADVPGWLNDDEGRLLAKHAYGKRVLEVGSYYGRSCIWMARVAQSVVCVDTWTGTGADTFDGFLENIAKYGVAEKVETARGTLRQVKEANGRVEGSTWYNPEFGPFDLIFIDGNHDFTWVTADIEESLPLLSEGGLLAFHDYERPEDPGVKQAVDLLIQRGATVVDRSGSIIILQVTHGRTETNCETTDSGFKPELSAVGTGEFTAVASW
jgi:predicted O-methyltransferase YrrM